MRGLVAIAAALCVAVLVAPAWSGASTTATTAVGVSEREWLVALGRLKAPHGHIELFVHNYGQDDHNLAVRRLGVQYGFTGRIAAGGQKTLTVTLKPGVYNLFCSLPGHRQLGMVAQLTVT
jgi:plastocyanin